MFQSLADVLIQSAKKYPDSIIYRYRDKNETKRNITYADYYQKVNAFARGLGELKLTKKHIALFSENRIEWGIADMAILGTGGVDVPRGVDSSIDELMYIVKHSDSKAIIVEDKAMYDRIKPVYKNQGPVIILDNSYENIRSRVYSFNTVLELGSAKLKLGEDYFAAKAANVKRADLATIIYTSGTTGIPKGVMLEHGNILHNVEVLPEEAQLRHDDKMLSILPIWHIYERMITYAVMSYGIQSVYSNKRELRADLAAESPTILISVPAIWVNIYKAAMKNISSQKGVRRQLAEFLVKHAEQYVRFQRGLDDNALLTKDETRDSYIRKNDPGPLPEVVYGLAQKVVFNKLQQITGGNLRFTISGGGALPMYIEDFLEACGITLRVGWGITETSPVISLRPLQDNVRGTAGMPVENVEVEVRDKEGRALPQGETGIFWIKGPNVMRGYYKDPKRTAEAIVNGWFNSGDLGYKTPKGHIVIVGREKETIVLLNGKNIEPEPIEDKLLQCNYIEQALIVGQDRKFLGALIYPNIENVKKYLHDKKIILSYEAQLFEHPDVEHLFKQEIAHRINSKNGFRDYERIVRFAMIKEPFTVENGLMTQSLKIKRNKAFERYDSLIAYLYHGS